MSDETTKIEPMAPFLYAVVYPCGEIFTTHKSKRIALGIAMQEREWVAGCTVIPLYAVPKSLSENASQMNEVEINISAKEAFLALSSAAFKRENELEQKLSNSEDKCAALAAENAGLNKFIKADCWVWDDKNEEYLDAVDCMPETPATDAYMSERGE